MGHVACMGDKRNLYKILVGSPEGKRPLERLGYNWECNINMNLTYIRWRVQIGLDQNRN
jgi:hypothetical protein